MTLKKRAFYLTLSLFLVVFFSAILIISIVSFQSSLSSAKEHSLREHYFIVSSLAKDLTALEAREITSDHSISTLYHSYAELYEKQHIYLVMTKDGQPFENEFTTHFPTTSDVRHATAREIKTIKMDDQHYIQITGTLPAPYDQYSLTYFDNISNVITSWTKSTHILLGIGFFFSIILALCLIVLFNRIFQPLNEIASTSQLIANGQYSQRLKIKGNDEISAMAISFNNMAAEIEQQMKELSNNAEQKQLFVDNLSHELRTPLTTIYGYAQYLTTVACTEEERLFAMNYIMTECKRLQNISSRLLQMAVLREQKLVVQEVCMEKLIQDVKQSIQFSLDERGVQLFSDIRFPTLLCERDLLYILLLNLIENAINASPSNSSIQLATFINNGCKTFRIQDNGKGMTKEQLKQVTEPFYRAEHSRSRIDGGAGLGLSLCKQIVTMHQANLSFTSEIGKGTTVEVTFTSSS